MSLFRRLLVGAVLLVAVLVGALREFVFINLNYQIDHVRRATRFSYAHSQVQAALHGADLGTLQLIKWLAAVLFIACGAGLCIAMDRAVRGSYKHAKAIAGCFAGVAALAFLLHHFSRSVPGLGGVSVQVLHMLQYPVPVLFVLFAGMLPRRGTKVEGGR